MQKAPEKKMACIKELIRGEENGTLSFGDYELANKTKKSDFEFDGDIYKVKTFKEITKLERNDMFLYESVPGTCVHEMKYTDKGMKFKVECPENAEITLGADANAEYIIYVNGKLLDEVKTNLGGKLTFSLEPQDNQTEVEIIRQ